MMLVESFMSRARQDVHRFIQQEELSFLIGHEIFT
jgi:hypothetical protein